MGAKSTRKGKVWERAVVNLFGGWGFVADRTAAALEAFGGPTGIDVRAMRSDGLRLAVQCKIGQCPSVWNAVDEVESSAHAREIPIAFVRRNQAKGRPARTLVVMTEDAFARLIEKQT